MTQQIQRRRKMPDATLARAEKIMDAISELMAARELVWRHGGKLEGAVLVKEKATKLLAEALIHAGCLAE